MGNGLTEEELAAIQVEIETLQEEHRDLDAAIGALQSLAAPDQLQVQRLKKRKLMLRDRLSHLEDMMMPDIIA